MLCNGPFRIKTLIGVKIDGYLKKIILSTDDAQKCIWEGGSQGRDATRESHQNPLPQHFQLTKAAAREANKNGKRENKQKKNHWLLIH